jgi:hypothetical protein
MEEQRRGSCFSFREGEEGRSKEMMIGQTGDGRGLKEEGK